MSFEHSAEQSDGSGRAASLSTSSSSTRQKDTRQVEMIDESAFGSELGSRKAPIQWAVVDMAPPPKPKR